MLSTVEGTLMEARASEEALGNLSEHAVPNDARKFFFGVAPWFPFFVWRFHFPPHHLEATVPFFLIIVPFVVWKKPCKTHKNIQHTFQKDETMVGSMLMSSDKYIQIQYVIYTCMYVWRVHLPQGPELGFPSFSDAFQWKQRHMTYKNASNHRGENGALWFLGGM